MKLPSSAVINVQNHGVLPSNSGSVNQRNLQDLIDTYCMNYESRKNYDASGSNDDNSSTLDIPTIFYFPNGTYLFTLETDTEVVNNTVPGGLRWTANVKFIGESRDGTVLKLVDGQRPTPNTTKNFPANNIFNSPAYFIGVGAAQSDFFGRAFDTFLEDLTIDTGSNNAGLVGLMYYGSNKTSIRNLKIRSSDGQGICGIFHRAGSLPGICDRIEVEGFNYSVRIGGGSVYTNSKFINPLTRCLHYDEGEGDNRGGGAGSYTLTLFNCEYTGDKQFLYTNAPTACLNLISNKINGTGTANNKIAVDINCHLFARDNQITGYQNAIRDRTYNRTFANNSNEYASNVYSLHGLTNPKSLRLTIPQKPTVVYPTNISDWVSVADFGANIDNSAIDSAAIQAAIDSGAKYIYFPRSTSVTGGNKVYYLNAPIIIRGNVEIIYGMDNGFKAESPNIGITNPIFKFESTTAPYLLLKGIGGADFFHSALCGVQHISSKPLILEDFTCGSPFLGSDTSVIYRSEPGCGNAFFDDVVGSGVYLNADNTVFAPYVNLESAKFSYPNPTNDREIPALINVKKGKFIQLFSKYEGCGENRILALSDGSDAFVEIIGVWNSITTSSDRPNRSLSAFEVKNGGKLSLQGINFTSFGSGNNPDDGAYYNFKYAVRETKNGTIQDILMPSLINGTPPTMQIALYSNVNAHVGQGYSNNTLQPPSTPTNLVASNLTTTGATISWTQTGTITKWVFDVRVSGATSGNVFDVTNNPVSLTGGTANTSYEVRIKSVNGTLESAFSSPLTFTTLSNTGNEMLQLELKFENPANRLQDTSGNNVTVTQSPSNTSFVNDSVRGWCLFVDGHPTDSSRPAYLTAPIAVGSSYTKMAYVKFGAVRGSNIISGDQTGETNDHNFWAATNTSNGAPNSFTLRDGHGTQINALYDSTVLSLNTWYHVASSFNASTGVTKLYINGVKVQESNTGAYTFVGGISPTIIGAYNTSGNSMNGYLDTVRIWNHALTDAEVLNYYNLDSSVMPPEDLANFSIESSAVKSLGLKGWREVVLVFNSTNSTFKIYVEGVEKHSETLTSANVADRIQLYHWADSLTQQQINGF